MTFKLPDNNDYTEFNTTFSHHPDLPSLDTFDTMNAVQMTECLTRIIFDSCCSNFLAKNKPRPKRRKHWLPKNIVQHIEVRRKFQQELKDTQHKFQDQTARKLFTTKLQGLIKKQKKRIKVLLSNHRSVQKSRIENHKMRKDLNLNNFWNFVRQHCRAMHSITAAYDDDGNVIFEQEKVANQVIHKWSSVFHGQATPVFPDSHLPDLPELDPNDPILLNVPSSPPNKHENFLCRPYTISSLKEILCKLKMNKSCGYDNIPAMFISKCAEQLCYPLTLIFNLCILHAAIFLFESEVSCLTLLCPLLFI